MRLPILSLVCLSAVLHVVTGCTQGDRDDADRAELRRLEARLAELERRATTQPAAAPAPGHHAIDPRQQPQTALDLLVAGNAAFAAGRPRPADTSLARVRELNGGQKPYAVVIGCSDSRTPPEHLFNAGLGDLFVVRLAGNVVDEDALASVEYAVAHLGCRLVVVLGHTACGAVKATVADAKDTPAVAALVTRIRPAVDEARRAGDGPDLADRAATANALRQRAGLRTESQLLGGLAQSRELRVVAARYDLADGAVDWLETDGLVLAKEPAAASPSSVRPPPPAPATGHGH